MIIKKDLIIVDNSPLAFAFDSENGLPIKTWYDDKNDTELYKIINDKFVQFENAPPIFSTSAVSKFSKFKNSNFLQE